ncbi:MAG: CvpA family protein [Verrucomicrobiota bacterium]|jgi:uncharacterized membrane protein required for colicin V production
MKPVNLPFNWFDFIVLIVLVVGILRGRKRGMSEELLDVFQWLVIVVVCAMLYKPLGQFLSGYTHMSLFMAYVSTYLFVFLIIKLVFSGLKRAVGEKLVQSDVFGKMEYYLGMLAGALRFSCMLLVFMAVFNAIYVSPEELAAQQKMQKENFGTISFPTIGSLQQDILHRSATGLFARKYLNEQLIVTTPYSAQVKREGPAKRLERAVDEVIEGKPRK